MALRHHRSRTVGSAAAHLAPGATRRMRIALSAPARRAVRTQRAPLATLVATMRDPRSGAVTSARATSVLF
jgi:hypothetical protein